MNATPHTTDTGGIIGKPLQMDAAHIAAIKRAIFARPGKGMVPMAQAGQGIHGAAGAPHGRPNGFIGAAVPQMGAQKAPGAPVAPKPTQSPASAAAASRAPATGQSVPMQPPHQVGGGGLEQWMPLMALLGSFLSRLLGGADNAGIGGGGGMFGGHTGIGHGGL